MPSSALPRRHALLSLFAATVLTACGGAAQDPASADTPSEQALKRTVTVPAPAPAREP